MSRSSPSDGKFGSPGSETAKTGQGFGLACAKRRKSCARAFGKMTKLACTFPAARPAVGALNSPARIRRRSRVPASMLRSVVALIARSRSRSKILPPIGDCRQKSGRRRGRSRVFPYECFFSRCRHLAGNQRDHGAETFRRVYPAASRGCGGRLLCVELCRAFLGIARNRPVNGLCDLVGRRDSTGRGNRDCVVWRGRRHVEAVFAGVDHRRGGGPASCRARFVTNLRRIVNRERGCDGVPGGRGSVGLCATRGLAELASKRSHLGGFVSPPARRHSRETRRAGVSRHRLEWPRGKIRIGLSPQSARETANR